MSYIHNIVAGKAEGDIVHAVLWVTCYTVTKRWKSWHQSAAVLVSPAPPVLWWVERTEFRLLNKRTTEVVRAVHNHERTIIVLHGKIQTETMRWITALHALQPFNLCTGCLGIQYLAIILLAAAPVGLRCSKFTASASFNSNCVSGTEAVSNMVCHLVATVPWAIGVSQVTVKI